MHFSFALSVFTYLLKTEATGLHSIAENLMLVLAYAQHVLKQVKQLFLAERRLRRAGSRRLTLRPPSRVLVAAHDLIELAHPRADDGLLGQSVDLGQAADASFDVVAEHLAEVCGRQSTALDHGRHALTAQEHGQVALDRAVESLVRRNRQLAVQE